MNPIALALCLLGSALAAPMRLTAPVGTVSTYTLEGVTRTGYTLVSARSLDGKGLPQGLRAAVEGSSTPPQIFNGERTETVLEPGTGGEVRVQVSQWNRSSALLLIGPRWQTDYTFVLGPQGEARAEGLQVRLLEPEKAPRSDTYEAAVRQGMAVGVLQNVVLEGYRFSSDLLPGVSVPLRLRREQLEAAYTQPQQAQDGPAERVVGRLTAQERTPEGGSRFRQDLESVQTVGGRTFKLFGRSEIIHLPDGRLLRSSGVSTSVMQLEPEDFAYGGRRFTVVRALVSRTEGSSTLLQTP